MTREIEPIEIVYTKNGRRDKKSFNWLLGMEADWAYEVNPFLIQDHDIARKVKDLMYRDRPVDEQLLSKYPKHGLDIYFRPSAPTETETTAQDYEQIMQLGISEIKMMADENPDFDIDIMLEIERKGKNRKTLIDYLNGIK